MTRNTTLSRRTVLKQLGAAGAAVGLGSIPVAGYDADLESLYHLDGSSATDSSGNGNDGTINGATTGATGVADDCFAFDGVDDVVDVPHVLSGNSAGSVSAWVNADSFGEDRAILGDWPGGSFVLYYDVGDDQWGFVARAGGSITKTYGGIPSTGTWTHLVGTYDGSAFRLYVDGTEVDSTSANGSFDSDTDIQIGSDNGDHNYWDGRIDEVRFYSRGLSASEVQTLYDEPASAELDGGGSGGPDVTNVDWTYQSTAFDKASLDYNPTNEFIFPCVIETSNLDNPLGNYYLYYAPHDAPGGVCLAYSNSLDNGSWTEYANNPVISKTWSPHYDVSHISSPHALWLDDYGELYLYFHGENTQTRWATSTDGIDFDYGGIAVTANDMPDSSESSYARVFEYAIPDRSNQYVMLFMDNQSGTRHIRLATSTDAQNWTIDSEEVITPNSAEQGNVSGPYFFQYDGGYYLAYHASSGDMHVAEVGENLDLEDHLGTFHDAMSGSPDDGRSASPYLIQDGSGTTYMYYEAGGRTSATIAYETTTDSNITLI